MARISTKGSYQEPDLSFLFPDFFDLFSVSEPSKELLPQEEPSYEDYLQKGERLLSLAKEKFTRVVGKIQLTDCEEKIFSSAFAESDSLYDIASKIARVYTRPLLKSIEKVDDPFATSLIDAVAMPSLQIRIEPTGCEEDRSFASHIKRDFSKYKKITDVTVVKLCIDEDGFDPLVVYGALQYAHPESIKKVVYESGSFTADLGLLTAYLIIYKQLATTFCKIRQTAEEGMDMVAVAFEERLQSYEKQFIQQNIIIWPKENSPMLKHFTLKEIFLHPVHIIGVQKGDVAPFAADFLASHGMGYIDHPTYSEYRKAMSLIHDTDKIRFHFKYGHSQLCFAFFLKEHIPFHYFLRQFISKGKAYWVPLPDSKSSRCARAIESEGMKLLADLFRIIALQKHSQQQMLTYYRDLERTYAKSYMLKKTTSQKIQNAMAASLFNEYFGFVEFDLDTDIEKAEEIALEFRAVKETYFPAVNSKENAIRFRKLGQHKALGLYYPSLACLCVDIRSPSSLIHEFGHLIDYCYGSLSEMKAFAAVKRAYVEQLDKVLEQDEDLKKKLNSSGKYNRAYYTMPTEIFARCFELYVSQCLGVRNSIVPATFHNPAIYPTDAKMLDMISAYFSNLPFVKSNTVQKELKCANA